ncbi:MAG: PaaI family thioesterase [Proteobacteria bacterium]|nr:PaaI family thioesterase [Pseudomonadota bacterium]
MFQPPSADFRERVRASFARQGMMATLGATLVDVAPGYCAIALVPSPAVAQQHGYVHAGAVSALVDTAGGYAGYTLFPPDTNVLTVEFKINLLAPAQGERLVAEGFVVKPGRTLAITRGEVHAEQGGRRTLVAMLQQTLMVMQNRPERG